MSTTQTLERAHRAKLRTRSPERAKLAEAIQQLGKAQAHVRDVEKAREENRKARSALFGLIDGAASDVEKAKADSAAHAIAQARGEAADAPRSVADVRAAVAAAREQLAALTEADAALQHEADAARNRIEYGRMSRDQALSAVVRSDPATRSMIDYFERTHAEFENSRRVVAVLQGHLGREHQHRADTIWNDDWRDLPAPRIWLKAIEALRENADAPLPAHFGLG